MFYEIFVAKNSLYEFYRRCKVKAAISWVIKRAVEAGRARLSSARSAGKKKFLERLQAVTLAYHFHYLKKKHLIKNCKSIFLFICMAVKALVFSIMCLSVKQHISFEQKFSAKAANMSLS